MNGRESTDLGLLLRWALTPRSRPSQHAEYRRLVDRLQQDAAFANGFDELADGLGLIVLSADDYGVVLGCVDESPFALRLGDFRTGMRTDDRVLYGLIVLALGAWCFPRSVELDAFGEGARRVNVTELTRYLVELANSSMGVPRKTARRITRSFARRGDWYWRPPTRKRRRTDVEQRRPWWEGSSTRSSSWLATDCWWATGTRHSGQPGRCSRSSGSWRPTRPLRWFAA